MTHVTDETLPFSEKAGTLRFAPLSSEWPDMSAKRGRFVEDWPGSWLKIGRSQPQGSRCERSFDFDAVTAVTVGPLVRGVSKDHWRWRFAMSDVDLRSVHATLDIHYMIGWESEDERDRAIAGQVKPTLEFTRSHDLTWPLVFDLERDQQGHTFGVYLAGAPLPRPYADHDGSC